MKFGVTLKKFITFLIAVIFISIPCRGFAEDTSAPSKEEFFKLLGLSEADVTPPMKSKIEPKITPKIYNFLNLNSIDTMTRTILYSQESCGARSFQFIALENPAQSNVLLVFYPCSEKCLGSKEIKSKAEKQASKQIELPKGLCTYLWGRSLNTVEMNGL